MDDKIQKARNLIEEEIIEEGVVIEKMFLFKNNKKPLDLPISSGQSGSDKERNFLIVTDRELTFIEKQQLVNRIKKIISGLNLSSDVLFQSKYKFEKLKTKQGTMSFYVDRYGEKLF